MSGDGLKSMRGYVPPQISVLTAQPGPVPGSSGGSGSIYVPMAGRGAAAQPEL